MQTVNGQNIKKIKVKLLFIPPFIYVIESYMLHTLHNTNALFKTTVLCFIILNKWLYIKLEARYSMYSKSYFRDSVCEGIPIKTPQNHIPSLNGAFLKSLKHLINVFSLGFV